VKFIKAAKLRRIIPAGTVAAILALAYLAPLPSAASSTNNCGVKGGYAYGGYAYAFHDHGKPCPNRPFPGKGKGIQKFLPNLSTASVGHGGTLSNGNGKSSSLNDETTATSSDSDTQSTGNGHSKGKGHASAKGKNRRFSQE